MGKSTCSIPKCSNKIDKQGRCSNHYRLALESGELGNREPCKWPGCGKFYSAKQFCSTHYARARRIGNLDNPWVDIEAKRTIGPCVWPECDRLASSSTSRFCRKCYQRARKMGNFEDPWVTWRPFGVADVPAKCKWEGCDRDTYCSGYCRRDYSRAKRLKNFVDPWTEWITDGECEVCGKKWKNARNRNKRVCSKACHAKAWNLENPERAREIKMNAVRRRRARLAGSEVEHFDIEDVRMFHGDDCYLCGESINYRLRFPNPKSPSMDHIKPISAGGSHTVENCAMTHLECNLKKHANALEEPPSETLFHSLI